MRVIRPGRADSWDGMQIYLSNFTLPEFWPQPITIQVFSLCLIQSPQLITSKGDNTGDKYAYLANKVISFQSLIREKSFHNQCRGLLNLSPNIIESGNIYPIIQELCGSVWHSQYRAWYRFSLEILVRKELSMTHQRPTNVFLDIWRMTTADRRHYYSWVWPTLGVCNALVGSLADWYNY